MSGTLALARTLVNPPDKWGKRYFEMHSGASTWGGKVSRTRIITGATIRHPAVRPRTPTAGKTEEAQHPYYKNEEDRLAMG